MATPETDPGELSASWCESGTPTTDIDADGGDIAHGWPLSTEPPPRQRWNWVLWWLMKGVRHLLHIGVGPVVAGRSYAVGDVVCGNAYTGNRFRMYRCILAFTATSGPGSLPGTDTTHWAPMHYNQQDTDEAIDTKLGTLSGALAGGTITASGTATVGYCRALRFPNSTEKIVACRLTTATGGLETTLTLSGAAAFAAGADGAIVGIQNLKTNVITEPPILYAKIVDETHVYVYADLTESVDLEVQIRGH
jgi:hypothetical protein